MMDDVVLDGWNSCFLDQTCYVHKRMEMSMFAKSQWARAHVLMCTDTRVSCMIRFAHCVARVYVLLLKIYNLVPIGQSKTPDNTP